MSDLHMITAEFVDQLAHGVYRRQLDSDKARAAFDELSAKTKASRAAAQEGAANHG